MFVAIAILS